MNKVYNIDTETPSGLDRYQALLQPDSDLFQELEKRFDEWINDAPSSSEYNEMYFSEDAIYDKRGAIHGAIELIFEVMKENNLPFIYLNDKRLDLTCAFAD